MDKFGGIMKGGWHPTGDKPIHRESWKKDMKGIVTGKKEDPYEEARNHQSRPLASLRDPDSFGPPPKHSAYYGSQTSTPTTPQRSLPAGGWGASVPKPQPTPEESAAEEPPKPPEPYRVNTTGLRTDNLPAPPVRRDGAGAASQAPTPSLPPRVPPRQAQAQPSPQPSARAQQPPPILPPRQNEYPDEYTPAPPPPYTEVAKQSPSTATSINQGAAQRLGQAGVSVPGFGIGAGSNTSQSPVRGPQGPQLSELQQRFARMNAGGGNEPSSAPVSNINTAAAPAQKKGPPPTPKKKPALNVTGGPSASPVNQAPAPPPLPLSSKPKPS